MVKILRWLWDNCEIKTISIGLATQLSSWLHVLFNNKNHLKREFWLQGDRSESCSFCFMRVIYFNVPVDHNSKSENCHGPNKWSDSGNHIPTSWYSTCHCLFWESEHVLTPRGGLIGHVVLHPKDSPQKVRTSGPKPKRGWARWRWFKQKKTA